MVMQQGYQPSSSENCAKHLSPTFHEELSQVSNQSFSVRSSPEALLPVLAQFIISSLSSEGNKIKELQKENFKINPTLHGLQNVAVYTGVGHYGPPLLNASKGHFWGQML